MNTRPILKAALEDIGIPAAAITYQGEADEYITYNDTISEETMYADDESHAEVVTVNVHYFTRRPDADMRAEIKSRMKKAGFFGFSHDGPYFEYDTKFYHLIIRAQIEGPVDESEE